MTVKKAIQFLDEVIRKKTSMKNDFLNLDMPWNKGLGAIPEFSQKLALVMDSDIQALQKIKGELQIKCKHPKKLLDMDPERKLYCMGCNQDL